MEEFLTNWINIIVDWIGQLGPIAGILLIILESIIPILPLAVFIALNFQAFGMVWGFIISWTATIIGCMIAYNISEYLSRKYFKGTKSEKLNNMIKKIEDIPLSQLVLILAIPFLPAFLINIAAGLCKVVKKKFLIALMIGKLSIVYFWGYVGKSFMESITDIGVLIRIGIIMVVVFAISKIISKKMNIG